MESADVLSSSDSCGLGCSLAEDTSPTQFSAAAAGTALDSLTPNALSLCGTGDCLPDDRVACAGFEPPAIPDTSEPGPPTVSFLDASLFPDSGASGADSGAVATDAGPSVMVPPSVDSGFAPSAPTLTRPSTYACQIQYSQASDSQTLTRGCGLAGGQDTGEACSSAADCAPGLGCVGSAKNARCLPYCCGSESPCDDRSYCTHSPLFDERLNSGLNESGLNESGLNESVTQTNAPLIPVCEPVDGCSLSEPYPCPDDQDCSCGAGEACTVVRSDGATACTVPSPNARGEGEACPCMAGFICSQSVDGGTCRRLCQLGESETSGCGTGLCQITGGLPAEWGTCVASSSNSTPD